MNFNPTANSNNKQTWLCSDQLTSSSKTQGQLVGVGKGLNERETSRTNRRNFFLLRLTTLIKDNRIA